MSHFANPILPPHSADPWMIYHQGSYYYCAACSRNRSIEVRKTGTIFGLGEAKPARVWTAPSVGPYSHAVWAPELHWINQRWYIYFAADDGRNENHRMWVLESVSSDPQGEYRLRGSLETNGWAIDGTVFEEEGRFYFLWSGWPGEKNGTQNLYIAPMQDPATLAAPRSLIAQPDQPWERMEMAICEGPQVLKRNGKLFVVYSASGSWCQDYCLGMLRYAGGDLLNAASWQKIGPVFQRTKEVWGVGHCCFVPSPCGSQDWLLYHSKSRKKKGWVDRDVHAQQFFWDATGWPRFGRPVGRDVLLPTGLASPPLPQAA